MEVPPLRVQTLCAHACTHALETLATIDSRMLPFVMAQKGNDLNAKRFFGEELEECLARARAEAATLADADVVALAYEGYMFVDGIRSEAVLVEVSEPGSDRSYIFGQRYRPTRFRQPASRKGRPQLVGEAAPLVPVTGETATLDALNLPEQPDS